MFPGVLGGETITQGKIETGQAIVMAAISKIMSHGRCTVVRKISFVLFSYIFDFNIN